MGRRLASAALICALATLPACGGARKEGQTAPPAAASSTHGATGPGAETTAAPPAGVCSNADGALSESAFVFVESPKSGERVTSGFRATGCSNTFEATVAWRLRARDGRELAHGFTQGGNLEAPGPFTFTVEYSVSRRQVGRLQVFMPRVTEEGFPPPEDVVPLVLGP